MTKRVATAIGDTFDPNGIHVQQHNGVAGWQTIPHVHFHVIARRGDEIFEPTGDGSGEVVGQFVAFPARIPRRPAATHRPMPACRQARILTMAED